MLLYPPENPRVTESAAIWTSNHFSMRKLTGLFLLFCLLMRTVTFICAGAHHEIQCFLATTFVEVPRSGNELSCCVQMRGSSN
jgi:hypothetical protein